MSASAPMTASDLSGFTGSEEFYRHPLFRRHIYTEGVQYMAERAGAHWLVEAIFSHQIAGKVRAQEFQVWTLKKLPDNSARLILTNGNTKRAIVTQRIEFTDFPMDEFVLWLVQTTLLLPSEY